MARDYIKGVLVWIIIMVLGVALLHSIWDDQRRDEPDTPLDE